MYQLLKRLLTPKETRMSKTQGDTAETPNLPRITFTGGDYKPKRLASGLIGFRAPFDIEIQNGKEQTVDLQTVCSHALLLIPEFQTDPSVVSAQGKIVVNLLNDHGDVLRFKAGDVIARAYPLFPVNYNIG